MKKDYKNWTQRKIEVNNLGEIVFFHKKEIWSCSLGKNVGFEQDGGDIDFQRPVVVIKKFNEYICWAIPLSRTSRRNKYYYPFSFDGITTSVAILSQIRLIDARRPHRKIGDMSEADFYTVIKKLKNLLS